MKKIDFKKPKYILPLVILIPLLFLVYNLTNLFRGGDKPEANVVRDSINTALPEADSYGLEDKLSEMNKSAWEEGYTAVNELGQEEEEKDEAKHGYTEAELDRLDKEKAEREREAKAKEELERALAESRRHYNTYQAGSPPSRSSRSSNSQYDEMEEYAKALEEIQHRNQRRNSAIGAGGLADYELPYGEETAPSASDISSQSSLHSKGKAAAQPKDKPEIVYKTTDKDASKFHTLTSSYSSAEESLIKAIIDKTTKVRTGTRLRFKLLDDVSIKGVTLKKGTYLYGLVDGFNGQRVTASISSILIKDKFVKVNLSVYDNDGMEGFYVPESLFRNFVKDASSSAISNNININQNGGAALSGESIALQALQNLYSSATTAVSNNIRRDKARIKYNTIVYLINSQTNQQ